MKKYLLPGVLALAALLLVGWWLRDKFEYVSEDHTLPPRGQAAYDPLYAASLALKAYGAKVEVQPFFDAARMKLRPQDSVVMYSDVRTLSVTDVGLLRYWVQGGGHLVVQLPDDEGDPGTLLSDIGVQVTDGEYALCPRLMFAEGAKPEDVDLCGRNVIAGQVEDYARSVGAGGKLFYAERRFGKGWIAVVSSMAFMDNAALKQPGNRSLMLRVLQPTPGPGRIYLLYSVDVMPLPLLILEHGWPVLVALALLVLAFLWSVAPRFGPVRPAAPLARRALLEHIRAGAELLWRGGAEKVLYQAAREDMLRLLQRRHPAAAGAERRALLDLVTRLTGLPRLDVRTALGLDGPDVRARFVQRIATLAEIRKRL